jgi:hypothetical protein
MAKDNRSSDNRGRGGKPYQGRPQPKRFTPQFKVGDQVYFHFALKDGGSLECRGFVLRLPAPKTEGEIYKVVIAAITSSSLGLSKLAAHCVVGSKVRRKIEQLSTQAPGWWGKEWVIHTPQRVQEAVNRARHGIH